MAKIVMYTKTHCPYCDFAKQLLASKKVQWQEINIENSAELRAEMEKLSGRRTVPQIFIDDKAIGGFDDLSALAKSGELDKLLK